MPALSALRKRYYIIRDPYRLYKIMRLPKKSNNYKGYLPRSNYTNNVEAKQRTCSNRHTNKKDKPVHNVEPTSIQR